jgi:hypothetical protein
LMAVLSRLPGRKMIEGSISHRTGSYAQSETY